jgi:hypothetical protein
LFRAKKAWPCDWAAFWPSGVWWGIRVNFIFHFGGAFHYRQMVSELFYSTTFFDKEPNKRLQAITLGGIAS